MVEKRPIWIGGFSFAELTSFLFGLPSLERLDECLGVKLISVVDGLACDHVHTDVRAAGYPSLSQTHKLV